MIFHDPVDFLTKRFDPDDEKTKKVLAELKAFALQYKIEVKVKL